MDENAPDLDTDTDIADPSLTPWFEAEALPARTGVYQRSFPAGPYTRWDGRQWLGDASTPVRAAASTLPNTTQAAPWRGLSQPPLERDALDADADATPAPGDAVGGPESD